jgi:ribosomal protein S18 acetylase RimI-like enzyme
VGVEAGTTFFGRSQVVDPLGTVLAQGDDASETLIYAEVDLELARQKTKEPGEGQYAVRLFADRRPELYGPLTEGAWEAGRRLPDDRPTVAGTVYESDATIEPHVYRALRRAIGWSDPALSDADLRAALARTWNVVVRNGDRVVGIGRLLDDGALYATIWDMIVDPECQRRGIGRAILDALLARASARTIVALVATPHGRPLYESMGFALESNGSVGMLMRPGDGVLPPVGEVR